MHRLACEYARAPSPDTLNAALEAALPLCALIARRFSGRGAEFDDLYQTACLACVKAIQSFEPDRGFQFSTFVTPSVTGAVRNYVRDQGALLRTPRALKTQGAALRAAREAFFSRHHREPSLRELAAQLSWDVPRVIETLTAQAAAFPLSLDQRLPEGGALGEQLPLEETGFEAIERRQDLEKALSALTDVERKLLTLRYQEKRSQRETARLLNLTQMQISRMERRILSALRKEMIP